MKYWESSMTKRNVRLRAVKVRFSQSDFRILRALHNLSEGKKRRKKVTLGSRFTLSRAYESCLACQHFISKLLHHWSLTTWIKQSKRTVVLGWAGVCGEGRNTSSPRRLTIAVLIAPRHHKGTGRGYAIQQNTKQLSNIKILFASKYFF